MPPNRKKAKIPKSNRSAVVVASNSRGCIIREVKSSERLSLMEKFGFKSSKKEASRLLIAANSPECFV